LSGQRDPGAEAGRERVATIRRARTSYRYLQLCDAIRVNGRPRDRVLYSFGNLDKLAPATLAALSDSFARLAGTAPASLATKRVWEYGALAAWTAMCVIASTIPSLVTPLPSARPEWPRSWSVP